MTQDDLRLGRRDGSCLARIDPEEPWFKQQISFTTYIFLVHRSFVSVAFSRFKRMLDGPSTGAGLEALEAVFFYTFFFPGMNHERHDYIISVS